MNPYVEMYKKETITSMAPSYTSRDVSIEDVSKIIEASTAQDIEALVTDYGNILPMFDFKALDIAARSNISRDEFAVLAQRFKGCRFCSHERRLTSISSIQQVLKAALELRRITSDPSSTMDDLSNIGSFLTVETLPDIDKYAAAIADRPESNLCIDDFMSNYHVAQLSFLLPPCDYQVFLSEACSSLQDRKILNRDESIHVDFFASDNSGNIQHDVDAYDVVLAYFEITARVECSSEYAAFALSTQLLDALCTTHLYDVSCETTYGGLVVQKCRSVLSSLWLCLCQSFRQGRAGKCIVCGTPFLATSERSHPRIYCHQEKCKKYAQRHPERFADVAAKATASALKQLGRA